MHSWALPIEQHFQGCWLGLAVGDAMGTIVELKRRNSFAAVTDRVGHLVSNHG